METGFSSTPFSLTGAISLFNYLATSAQRTQWYRAIMRTMLHLHRTYQQYIPEQQIREAVQHLLGQEYRVEHCRSDLEQLVAWGNLTSVYDIEHAATTIAEFIHRPLRYQPTPEGIAIENFLESQLQQHRRTGALEQSSLQLIYEMLVQLDQDLALTARRTITPQAADEAWNQIFELWSSLAENAALYLSTIAEVAQKGGSNLEAFLRYKRVVVQYVHLFASALLEHGRDIHTILVDWTASGKKTQLIELIVQHQLSIIPEGEGHITQERVASTISGQLEALEHWFAEGSNTHLFRRQAEKEIEQVVRRASTLAFTKRSPLNYATQLQTLARHLLHMPDGDSARQLFTSAFATLPSLHFTETLFGPVSVEDRTQPKSAWELPPGAFPQLWTLGQRSRSERIQEKLIPDQRKELQQLRAREYRRATIQQQRFATLFQDLLLDLGTLEHIDAESRALLEEIIDTCLMNPQGQYHCLDGSTVTLMNPQEQYRVALSAPDGILRLPRYRLLYQNNDVDQARVVSVVAE